MKYFLVLLLLFCTQDSYAQQDSISLSNGKQEKVFSLKSLRAYRDSVNNSHVGEAYPLFFFNTSTGKHLDNESIKDKITFIAFFCDEMSCWDIDKLQNFYDSIKDDPNIVFVAVCFGIDDMSTYIKKRYITFPVVNLSDLYEVHRLNFNSGFPSYVIIDKDGKVASLQIQRIGDDGFATITALKLCNKITDLLIK